MTVTAVNNDEDAPDKSVTVSGTVSGTVSLDGVTAPADATLTIADDDEAVVTPPPAETPVVTLVLTPDSIGENGGASTVTATVSPASAEAFTMTVSAAAVAPAVGGRSHARRHDTEFCRRSHREHGRRHHRRCGQRRRRAGQDGDGLGFGIA